MKTAILFGLILTASTQPPAKSQPEPVNSRKSIEAFLQETKKETKISIEIENWYGRAAVKFKQVDLGNGISYRVFLEGDIYIRNRYAIQTSEQLKAMRHGQRFIY